MKLFIASLLWIAISSGLKAQTNSVSKENWRPMIIEADHSNTQNGVSFFKKTILCNGKNVMVFKLLNSNNFKVKVSWKSNGRAYALSLESSANAGGSCETYSQVQDFAKSLSIAQESYTTDQEIFSTLVIEEEN